MAIAVLLFGYYSFRTLEGGDYVRTSIIVILVAAVPIPFLVWAGAGDHFAPRTELTPSPPAQPIRSSAGQTLNDRWHTFGR